jgi:hypothetical protein
MRAVELIFGVRRDLDLDSRWWHRLAKVALVVAVLPVAGFALLIAMEHVYPNTGNAVVLTDLVSFGKGRPDGNYVPAFLASPGELGRVSPSGGISSPDVRDVGRIICDVAYTREAVAAVPSRPGEYLSFNPNEPFDLILPDSPGGSTKRPHCVVPMPSRLDDLKSADSIVKYEMAWRARASKVGIAILLVVGWVALLTNVYWRGVIYIAFGPRGRGTSPPLVPGT